MRGLYRALAISFGTVLMASVLTGCGGSSDGKRIVRIGHNQATDHPTHVALLEFENIRIMKEMRNSVNRKVNCETANINKTVSAAVRQIEDIKYIRDTVGFDRLHQGLRDVALTRLAYPDASLKELGELLDAPVGKSGVNHRLRRLSEIAVKLRDSKED